MTPMIDIVFQLIIFFVVTLKMTSDFNPDIILEDGKHGEIIKNSDSSTQQLPLIIEVARNGRVSMNNATISDVQLRGLLRARVNRMGANFPILIRGDRRASHEQVKRVMDICTEVGIWKLSFVAVQEKKVQN